MSVSTLVTAALPIPVAALHLIPTYESQTKFLSTYASLFCFLILSFVFYLRHSLARVMFGRLDKERSLVLSLTPLLLILLAASSVVAYHFALQQSLDEARTIAITKGLPFDTDSLLKTTDLSSVPNATKLSCYFLGIFIFSEAAFLIMALREYLQDLLGHSDAQLIGSRPS